MARNAANAASEAAEQDSEPRSNDSTPNRKNRLLTLPRTPTPFKDALAKLEKKNGAVKKMVSSFFIYPLE